MGRSWKRAMLGLPLAVVVLAAAALGTRAWRQHETAEELRIRTPNGVEETLYVPLGGPSDRIEQWVQIRGDDRRNPVLLFIHGGPGASESALSALFRPWERHFTVVMWDQRCAAKTFERNGAQSCNGMSIAGVANEGIQLAEFLRKRLGHRKIIALGHSWGTMVGVTMVHARPDLFSAYVGTGQVMSTAEKEPVIYARAMARLRAAHAEAAIARLKTVYPPYRTFEEIMVERALSDQFDIPAERDLRYDLTSTVLFAPGWSALDIYWFLNSGAYAQRTTMAEVNGFDARRLGPDFQVPFFILDGAMDNNTPVEHARRYFDFVRAPHKAFVSFPNAGHSAVLTEPGAFLRELVARVRPVAIQNENGALHG